jgi:MoaA/NifB/PqqE/SkfB family radical SAM enzyme
VLKTKLILENLSGRTTVIWGARMTGLGALRKCRAAGIEPLAFIDSDRAFSGKNVAHLPVYSPEEFWEILPQLHLPAILIAVALKEDEILAQIEKSNNSSVKVISFYDPDCPYYTVDILGSCNLKCSSCPHSIDDHSVPKGSMELHNFKLVFDKIIADTPDISHLSLYSWGEPLLHPYVADIVEYVHTKNVAVALSSNLSIRFENRLDQLIQKNPDYLKISVSGFYPDAYNSTHQGGDIDLVKANLCKIRGFIDKYHSDTLVDINYHLYRNNNDKNLSMFRQLANDLGFLISETYALVMPLERVIDYLEGNPDKKTKELADNLLVTIDEGITASSQSRLNNDFCPFRENQVNINSDLTVPVCCTVFHREGIIVAKNFLESDPASIRESKGRVELCKKCTQLALPEYNLGLNRKGWESFARMKSSLDKV